MHPALAPFGDEVPLTGDLTIDVPRFLGHFHREKTALHSSAVAAEAMRIAQQFDLDVVRAGKAGWLHDISAVLRGEERLRAARELGLEVLPEEAAYPGILHQKLSVVLARELFGIIDEQVLGAIGHHTTLCAHATPLEKVVFVADKIAWDQAGQPPYLAGLLGALDVSFDEAAMFFLRYLWSQRETLPVVHPWLREAVEALEK